MQPTHMRSLARTAMMALLATIVALAFAAPHAQSAEKLDGLAEWVLASPATGPIPAAIAKRFGLGNTDIPSKQRSFADRDGSFVAVNAIVLDGRTDLIFVQGAAGNPTWVWHVNLDGQLLHPQIEVDANRQILGVPLEHELFTRIVRDFASRVPEDFQRR